MPALFVATFVPHDGSSNTTAFSARRRAISVRPSESHSHKSRGGHQTVRADFGGTTGLVVAHETTATIVDSRFRGNDVVEGQDEPAARKCLIRANSVSRRSRCSNRPPLPPFAHVRLLYADLLKC